MTQPPPGAPEHERTGPEDAEVPVTDPSTAHATTSRAHTIVYVPDQSSARTFWRTTLGAPPQLDVPGMTEFVLTTGAVLGLMPRDDILELLPALDGGAMTPFADETTAPGGRTPGVELYLVTDDADALHRRALAAGASELSPMARRAWGAEVAYSLSPDGVVVIAFARS